MRAFAIAVAAAAVLLAGCGNDERAKSGAQVIADARHARDSASSVLVNGTFSGPARHSFSGVHLWVATGEGGAGWVDVNLPSGERGSYDIRAIGTDLYVRGDLGSTRRPHGGPAPPKGTWLKASTTSGPLAKLYSIVAPSKLFPILDSDPSTLTDRGWDNLGDNNNDNHAEVIIDSTDGGEMRIRASGTPYPDSTAWDNRGTELEFSDWNAPVPITAPKGAIDASRFGLG